MGLGRVAAARLADSCLLTVFGLVDRDYVYQATGKVDVRWRKGGSWEIKQSARGEVLRGEAIRRKELVKRENMGIQQ